MYVAQRGSGGTAEEAQTQALASLSRYFKTQVNAKLTTSLVTMQHNDEVDEESLVQDDVSVQSQVDLFGVETTEPYFSENLNKWYCVAYLEKEYAYSQIESQIEMAQAIFLNFVDRAKSERDGIAKRSAYKLAWEKGKNFISTLEYGRLLNPDADEMFSEAKSIFFEIPALMSDENSKLTVRLYLSGDYENIISTVVAQSFSDAGFIISEEGVYIARIYINLNESGSSPLVAFPSIKLELSSQDGSAVFSYRDKVEKKTVSYSEDSAKKKSYPLLAKLIENNLTAGLREKFGTD